MTTEAPAELRITPMKFNLGQIREVEKLVGRSWKNIDWDDMSADLLIALVYVARHREDPSFTVEDAEEMEFAVVIEAFTPPADSEVESEDPTSSPTGNGAA